MVTLSLNVNQWCAPELCPGWIFLVNIIIMCPIADRMTPVKSDTQDFIIALLKEFVGNSEGRIEELKY